MHWRCNGSVIGSLEVSCPGWLLVSFWIWIHTGEELHDFALHKWWTVLISFPAIFLQFWWLVQPLQLHPWIHSILNAVGLKVYEIWPLRMNNLLNIFVWTYFSNVLLIRMQLESCFLLWDSKKHRGDAAMWKVRGLMGDTFFRATFYCFFGRFGKMIYLVNLKKWGGGLKPPAPSAPPCTPPLQWKAI